MTQAPKTTTLTETELHQAIEAAAHLLRMNAQRHAALHTPAITGPDAVDQQVAVAMYPMVAQEKAGLVAQALLQLSAAQGLNGAHQ